MIEAVFRQFVLAAETAAEEGLGLNAGHDLNLLNLPRFATAGLLEVSIGHALTVDAIRIGSGTTRWQPTKAGTGKIALRRRRAEVDPVYQLDTT